MIEFIMILGLVVLSISTAMLIILNIKILKYANQVDDTVFELIKKGLEKGKVKVNGKEVTINEHGYWDYVNE